MNLFEAILLGAVQGLTEFLPVSSSGHLVLMQQILGVDVSGGELFLDLMLHVGTLLSLAILFFKDILGWFKPPFKTIGMLVVASVPAALVMFFFKDQVESLFGGKYLCFGFLATAILLLVTELVSKREREEKPVTWSTALIMGVCQGFAVIPGLSRSGTTISGGVLSGAKREEVARFSFFMSIPVIAGAAFVQIFDVGHVASADILPVLVGMASACLFGLLAIKVMLRVIARSNYKWFCLYLAALSVVTFVDSFVVSFL